MRGEKRTFSLKKELLIMRLEVVMSDKREIVNFVGLECARKAYCKRRERVDSTDVNWTVFLCSGIGDFAMNILVKDAHSINPKYAQQLLACIRRLMCNELSCNDSELKTIGIRRNGVVVAHHLHQKSLERISY